MKTLYFHPTDAFIELDTVKKTVTRFFPGGPYTQPYLSLQKTIGSLLVNGWELIGECD